MDTIHQYELCKSLEETMKQLNTNATMDSYFETQKILNGELDRIVDVREANWGQLSKIQILHILSMCGKYRPMALHAVFIAISMHLDTLIEQYKAMEQEFSKHNL